SLAALSVTNCTFENNQANAVGANFPAFPGFIQGVGGAIDEGGSSLALATGPVTITNSTFTGNQARGVTPGANAGGGAVNNFGSGIMTVIGSTFTWNQSIATNLGGWASGGALNLGLFGTMIVTDCKISSNAAMGAAGGDGVTTVGFASGGGIASNSNLIVRGSTIKGNLAL